MSAVMAAAPTASPRSRSTDHPRLLAGRWGRLPLFFVLSKTVGALATPVIQAILLVTAGFILRLFRRAPRLRRSLIAVGLLWPLLLATGPVSTLLVRPLESAYHHPERSSVPPQAIVMLTGMLDWRRVQGGGYYEFAEAGDRFVEAVRLAHRYPRALLVLSGGSSALTPDGRPGEAAVLARLARDLGIDGRRIIVDAQSRNTYENAVRSARLLKQAGVKRDVWLVTSALHMSRAVGCFRRVGVKVTPWPVDYQGIGFAPRSWMPSPGRLAASDLALHEYLGWLSYWFAGYV